MTFHSNDMKKRAQILGSLSALKSVAANAQKRAVNPSTVALLSTFAANAEYLINRFDVVTAFENGSLSERDYLILSMNKTKTPVEVRINQLIENSGGYASIRRRFRSYVDIRVAISKIIFMEYGDSKDALNGLSKLLGVDRCSVLYYKNKPIYPEIQLIINQLNTPTHANTDTE